MKALLIATMASGLIAAAPAGAQEGGVAPATQAGHVTLLVAGHSAFTDARAERSVRRAMRRHGFEEVHATCSRARGADVADCTVSATSGVVWSGTATVTHGRRVHRVEYLVHGC